MIYFSDFGAGGGSAIDYKTSESLGSQAVATSTPTTLVTLTFDAADQEANASYLVFWMTEASSGAVGVITAALYEGASAVQTGLTSPVEFTAPADIISFGSAYVFTAASTPATATFTIKGDNSAGTSTAFTNSRLVLLKLGADDEFATSYTRQTTASTSFTTAATLSFTPPTSGDYLIVAGMTLDNSGGVETCFQLGDGTTSTDNQGIRCGNSSRRWPNVCMLPLTGISGSKTITLSYRAVASTAGIAEVCIVAIRLDRFNSRNVTRLGTDNGGTNTSYTASLSQTFTPAAADYLTLAAGLKGNNSSSISSYVRFDDGGTVVGEGIYEHFSVSNGTREFPYNYARIANYAASSRTQALQRKSESTNTTTIWQDAVIASLELTGLVAG